jgi:hypothetical protein
VFVSCINLFYDQPFLDECRCDRNDIHTAVMNETCRLTDRHDLCSVRFFSVHANWRRIFVNVKT